MLSVFNLFRTLDLDGNGYLDLKVTPFLFGFSLQIAGCIQISFHISEKFKLFFKRTEIRGFPQRLPVPLNKVGEIVLPLIKQDHQRWGYSTVERF